MDSSTKGTKKNLKTKTFPKKKFLQSNTIDASDRKTQELLENQFTKSKSILEPLKAGIKATDELIDEIVYRLYGLAEEEIKVVKGEGSLTLLR